MKIIVLDGYAANPGDISWEPMRGLGELTVYERTPAELTAERIGDAEVVYTNKVCITADIMDACPNLRFVGVIATGYNIVDVKAAKERGILVANVPAYSTHAVAQMVFAQLLEICHHVGAHNDAVKRGDWTNCKDFTFWNYPLVELAGKTMGIVGYGQIGRAVAAIARAFGMNVLAYGPHLSAEEGVSMDEIYAKSDVISLNCPLNDATKGMICKESIAKMKDGVILINTARGGLLVEQDVKQALDSGKIFGMGVDVALVEPIPADSPLLTCPNCLITPHIAWAPAESRQRLMDVCVQNLKQFIQGEPIHIVNP